MCCGRFNMENSFLSNECLKRIQNLANCERYAIAKMRGLQVYKNKKNSLLGLFKG